MDRIINTKGIPMYDITKEQQEWMKRLPPTRKVALAEGTPHYFNFGKECKKGHKSPRLTKSGICLQCKKENKKFEVLSKRVNRVYKEPLWKETAFRILERAELSLEEQERLSNILREYGYHIS
jgi:hypothetical protein